MKPYGYVRADGKGLFIYGDHQFTNNLDHDLVPVYTHPKEWVGLTAGEIFDALISVDEKTVRLPSMLGQFACAIEAKLKEKNT